VLNSVHVMHIMGIICVVHKDIKVMLLSVLCSLLAYRFFHAVVLVR
jgi:hypothetical protein